MLTGEGAVGTAMSQGFGGAIPYFIAKDAREDREKERERTAAPQGAGYKKGGTVRGAGCATKGVKKCKVY
jgi:hypothetical protein